MNVLITYFSQTGNTKKIAEAIHEEASRDHESELIVVKKVKIENLKKYDLVFIGSACHDTDLAKPILRLLKKIPTSPKFKVAGFSHMLLHRQRMIKEMICFLNNGQGIALKLLKNLKKRNK